MGYDWAGHSRLKAWPIGLSSQVMRSFTSTLGATLPTGSANSTSAKSNLQKHMSLRRSFKKTAWKLTERLAWERIELDIADSGSCPWACRPTWSDRWDPLWGPHCQQVLQRFRGSLVMASADFDLLPKCWDKSWQLVLTGRQALDKTELDKL